MWYRPHNNLKQLKTIKMKFIEVKAITGKKVLINTKHIVSIKEGFEKKHKIGGVDKVTKPMVKICTIGDNIHTYESYEHVLIKII